MNKYFMVEILWRE